MGIAYSPNKENDKKDTDFLAFGGATPDGDIAETVCSACARQKKRFGLLQESCSIDCDVMSAISSGECEGFEPKE